MTLAAAGIAEISDEEWDSISFWIAGSFWGFVGSAILLTLACVAFRAWTLRKRYSLKAFLVYFVTAAAGLAVIRYGIRLRDEADAQRNQALSASQS